MIILADNKIEMGATPYFAFGRLLSRRKITKPSNTTIIGNVTSGDTSSGPSEDEPEVGLVTESSFVGRAVDEDNAITTECVL